MSVSVSQGRYLTAQVNEGTPVARTLAGAEAVPTS